MVGETPIIIQAQIERNELCREE